MGEDGPVLAGVYKDGALGRGQVQHEDRLARGGGVLHLRGEVIGHLEGSRRGDITLVGELLAGGERPVAAEAQAQAAEKHQVPRQGRHAAEDSVDMLHYHPGLRGGGAVPLVRGGVEAQVAVDLLVDGVFLVGIGGQVRHLVRGGAEIVPGRIAQSAVQRPEVADMRAGRRPRRPRHAGERPREKPRGGAVEGKTARAGRHGQSADEQEYLQRAFH